MKRIVAILLVLTMIFAFVACAKDNDDGKDTTGEGNNVTDTNDTTSGGEETDKPKQKEYEPDPDAKYGGMVGVGGQGGVVYFDNLKVLSRGGYGNLYFNDFEESDLSSFKYTTIDGNWGGDQSDWSITQDPLTLNSGEDTSEDTSEETAEPEKPNMVLQYTGDGTGAVAYTGDNIWNYYQLTVRVLPSAAETPFDVYFCMKDEKNYFVLTFGEDEGKKMNVYQVVDGTKNAIAFQIPITLKTEEWNAIGITVNRETIEIYVNGILYFDLFNPNFTNNYYEYTGDVIPASVSVSGFGAPSETAIYFPVAEDHVIHDGKGTWSNAANTVATKAFDMDVTTFYDCDEQAAYADTEAEIVGIPGDGTFETSYVGAWIEEGVILTQIRYYPRDTFSGRMLGGYFEASVDFENWVTIGEVDEAPSEGTFSYINVNDPNTYYYVRYVGPTEGYGNVCEIEIWGTPGTPAA